MQQPIRPLEDLRREIDEIDDAIHDLIMRRAVLLSAIAAAKGKDAGSGAGSFLRPEREASVLRRLVARHHGVFPKAALVRLWREIISAPLSLQGTFSVAVFAPEDEPGYWDLARDHYGSHAAFVPHTTASQAIAALGDGGAAVGVLPAIREEDPDPWWHLLARENGKDQYIMVCLPMAPSSNARGERLQALVVGPVAPKPTGRDRSYVAFEAGEGVSRARLKDQLSKVGLDPTFFAAWKDPTSTRRLILVEVNDFVEREDERLRTFLDEMKGSIGRVFYLGGYALPFDEKELKDQVP